MKATSPKSRVARPSRKSVGVRDRLLIINKDPSKEYRLVDSDPARVFQMEQMGYQIEQAADHLPKGLRVDSANLTDNLIPVGGGQRHVLMSIDKELYEEAQREKAEIVKETEAAINPNLSDGQYGKVLISTGKE